MESVMLTWIIPVYNGEKYLAQAIDSILRQPCGDFEILVIDDGSTDNSLKIAQSYTDSRVKAIHKENGGVSSARNLGIENAASRYIAFLDADDVVCRDAYDEKIHEILESEQYDLLSFSYYKGDQHLKWGMKQSVIAGEGYCDETQLDPFKHFCSLVYSNSLFDGKNSLRFPEGIKLTEDVAFHFMAHYSAEQIKYIDRVWFAYRNNIESAVHQLINPRNVMNYSIAAWHWCKKQCERKSARDHCDIRAFATIAEFIRMACGAGIPMGEIQTTIEKPEIKEILNNYDVLWKGSKAIYEAFRMNPRAYWWKQRIRGIVTSGMQFVARFPGIRILYMRVKYRENIEALV